MPVNIPVIVFLIVAASHGGRSTTLADAARYEAIRRALTPAATKSLTNADLPPEALRTEPELSAKIPELRAEFPDLRSKAPESSAKFPDLPVSESEWRARMTIARVALERDEVLADGMQSRVNALTSDSISRDDIAQRADLLKQRSRALVELDRLTLQIEKDKLAITAIEDDARKKGIPPGWLR